MIRPCAIGGGVLEGNNMTRLAYFDESGTGKIEKEPNAVIAGVIVNADKQAKLLEKYLSEMADDYLPPPKERKPTDVLHAKDMWHGSGCFSREKFPDKWKRRMILLEICELAAKFDLPVVYGYSDRSRMQQEHPEFSRDDHIAATLAVAAFQTMAMVERYMRRYKHELAIITYENNSTSKKIIRQLQNHFRSNGPDQDFKEWAEFFPFHKIHDPANMAEKHESSLLQIADAMAFAIARKLKNAEDCDYLFNAISPQLVARHISWGPGPKRKRRSGRPK
jgi:Protein of unknown function (DUF3800)